MDIIQKNSPSSVNTIYFLCIAHNDDRNMQAFDEPYFLTHGGPGDNTRTVAMFIYEKAFQSYDMGYASSVAALLFIAVFILTALQLYLQKKWVNYDYE